MIYKTFILLLFAASFVACDSADNDGTSDEPETVTTTDTDGVNAKSDGKTSTYEDQAAGGEISANSADYDGRGTSPAERAAEPDTLKYIQTPESQSTSPVPKKIDPENKDGK